MSGLLAVCKSDRVELLTDSAFTNDDGTIAWLASKQIYMPNAVLANNGWFPPCALFAELAGKQCADFDDMIRQAERLWQLACSEAVAKWGDPEADYSMTLAGWSAERGALELFCIDGRDNTLSECSALATGPTDECAEITFPFIERISDDLDAFDASRDGIALFESLRARRRQFDTGLFPCVGGDILMTTLMRDKLSSNIIHEWPGDTAGKTIEWSA